jgi:tetratricopeptide (TPR) repeat protein
MEQNDIILLDRYFDDQLSPQERQTVEARVLTEPELGADFALRQQQMLWLQQEPRRQAMLAQTADLGAQYFGEEEAVAPAPIRVTWTRRLLAAAAAVALLAVAVWVFRGAEKPTYAGYVQHAPLQLIQRGAAENTAVAAENAFNAGRYAEALPLLQNLRNAQPDNQVLQLYEGICYLEMNRNAEAMVVFQAIANGNSALKGEGVWYLALSHWKNGDITTCKQVLQQIQVGSDRYNQAQQLLSDL